MLSNHKFRGVIPLIAGGSLDINKRGDIARVATKKLYFSNLITEETFSVTDLQLQKQRRNGVLEKIRDTYSRLIKEKMITTLIVVASVNQYKKPSDFLKEFKKKLLRNNVFLLGYYWQRDIGDVEFECHYHIIFFLNKITGVVYYKLFKRKKGKYEAELCDSFNKFKGYLKRKEIYAPENKRSYGCSREFKKP